MHMRGTKLAGASDDGSGRSSVRIRAVGRRAVQGCSSGRAGRRKADDGAGVPVARARRGAARRPRTGAGQRQEPRPARLPAPVPQPACLDRAADRGALGRGAAAERQAGAAEPRLGGAARPRARPGRAGHTRARLPGPGRPGGDRRAPLRRPGRPGPCRPGRRRPRPGRRAAAPGAGPVARPGGGRRVRRRRPLARRRVAGGAPPGRDRGPHRGRPGPRPAPRARRRAARADRHPPTAGAAPRAAHARPVPLGPAGGGAGRLPRRPCRVRRRAGHRARRRAAPPRAGHPRPGQLAGAGAGRRDDRPGRSRPDARAGHDEPRQRAQARDRPAGRHRRAGRPRRRAGSSGAAAGGRDRQAGAAGAPPGPRRGGGPAAARAAADGDTTRLLELLLAGQGLGGTVDEAGTTGASRRHGRSRIACGAVGADLLDRVGGSPLFAEEYARMLRDRGQSPGRPRRPCRSACTRSSPPGWTRCRRRRSRCCRTSPCSAR